MIMLDSDSPELVNRVSEVADAALHQRPAFLHAGDRLSHSTRVERITDKWGDEFFYVICACGWVSRSFVFYPALDSERDCAVEKVMRDGERHVRAFREARG